MLATKRGKKYTLSKVLSGWRSGLATWREQEADVAAAAAAGQMQEVCKQKEMLLGKLSAQKQQRQQLEEELQQTIQALELKLVLTAQVKCTASSLQQLWSHDWILIFDVQAGAEGLMRKVALKMKNKELAGCVTEWRMTQQYEKAEHMAQERGEQIMNESLTVSTA